MSRILVLIRLKMTDLLHRRGLMLLIFFIPVLLGLIAGKANWYNRNPNICIGVVDQDHTAASAALIGALQTNGWQMKLSTEKEAQQDLIRKNVDGILTIESGFSDSLTELKETCLFYTPAEGSLATEMVREAIAAFVMPEHCRIMLLQIIEDQYQEQNQPIPSDLFFEFSKDMAAYRQKEAKLDIVYIGEIKQSPALTYVVNDYTMEVFFLSLFAVMGMMGLTDRTIQQRLAASRNGLLLDYTASLLALLIIGCLQILLYTVPLHAMMQTPISVKDLGLLFVFLYFMLGLGQFFTLIPENLRFFLSLMLLVCLAAAGGCFFQLPEKMLNVAQYVPHGWVLCAIWGYPALPSSIPFILGTLFIVQGYFVRRVRVRHL